MTTIKHSTVLMSLFLDPPLLLCTTLIILPYSYLIIEAIKTRSNQALVKFVSDHSGEYTGFKLLWKAYMKEFDNIVPVFQPDERG